MTQESVITEEMRKQVGVESQPWVLEVEKGAIRKFAVAIQDPNPLWQDEEYAKKSRYGGIIAPPAFICTVYAGTGGGRIKVRTSFSSGVAAGDDFEFYLPVRCGDVITSVAKVSEFREREGRMGKMLVTITETEYRNQKGELVARSWGTGIGF